MGDRRRIPRVNRRHPVLIAVLVAVVLIIRGVSAGTQDVPPLEFGSAAPPWIPAVPPAGGLSTAWYCPGVPATGETGVGGSVIVANPSDATVQARVGFLGAATGGVERVIEVAPRGRISIDVDAEATGDWVAVVVEVVGGVGLVEQRMFHPSVDGTLQSVTPCTTSLSSEWFLADGYTVGEARNLVVLSNPGTDTVVADVALHTDEGVRATFSGVPVPGRGVRVIDVAAEGAGARDDERVGVIVRAARGGLVAGRFQRADDDVRGAPSMTLAAPLTAAQWWFADGDKAPGANERFVLFNTADRDIEVAIVYLADGIDPGTARASVVVPAGRVATVDSGTVSGLPEGPHGAVVSTLDGDELVVERVLTRYGDGIRVTSIAAGVPVRNDGLLPTSWWLPAGPSVPVERGLVVLNLDNVERTVSVSALGADGEVALGGLAEVVVAPAGRVDLDLVTDVALNQPLVVRSDGRVLVERTVPSAGLFSSAWAIAGEPTR